MFPIKPFWGLIRNPHVPPPKGPYALVNQKLTTSFSQIISIMLLSMLSSYDYSKNKCPNFFSAYSGLMALQFTAKY